MEINQIDMCADTPKAHPVKAGYRFYITDMLHLGLHSSL